MTKASRNASHANAANEKSKNEQATKAGSHGSTPEHVDDRPKRDDDDLSALLQTSDPESSSRGKGASKKT